ncbi:hypothetical protein [Neoaquamicrobium sediminum]|uniref:hypothetical protein n=1 Tax=Neoaquamicrobium sediminum TaxID=1849104 RepID=UPI003BA9C435
MPAIRDAAGNTYADGPSSNPTEPSKADIRALFGVVEDEVNAAAAGYVVKATWAALSAINGTRNGQPGRVTGPDAGNHTDPVVGGSVANVGEYAWSVSPEGWQRVGAIVDTASLQAEIDAEESARIAADSAEATARANADTTLQNNINAEAAARSAAISSEATARAAADTALQNNINAEAAARSAAISSEATARAAADTALQAEIDAAEKRLGDLEDVSNILAFGDFIGGVPARQKGSRVTPTPEPSLAAPKLGIDLADFGDNAILPASDLTGKYLVGGFILIADEADIDGITGRMMQVDSAGISRSLTNYVLLTRTIAPGIQYRQLAGTVSREDTVEIYLGTSSGSGVKAWATAFSISVHDAPLSSGIRDDLITRALTAAALASRQPASVDVDRPMIDYPGIGVLATTWISSGDLTRQLVIDPPQPSEKPTVNFVADWIEGVAVRAASDDVAPLWLLGGVQVGANHGYQMSRMTATGHGKTLNDRGAIYANGGKNYMLVHNIDANTVGLTSMTDNVAPPIGTYTHVSGGSSTSSIVTTATLSTQMYPTIQKRQVEVFADGRKIEAPSCLNFAQSARIVERYEIPSKADLLDWWGAAVRPDPLEPDAAPLFTVTTTYEFDRDAQCTIYAQVYVHDDTPIARVSILQATKVGSPSYYVPKALEFTTGGQLIDLANIVSAATMAAAGTVDLTPDRVEPTGILADRAMMIDTEYTLATGFLPVQTAGDDRRLEAVLRAMIVSSAGKIYMSGVEKSGTIPGGTTFNFVAYRHMMKPRSDDATAAYAVRSVDGDYLYFDWHDFTGRYLATVPQDLRGRPYEVVEAKDATVSAKAVSDPLAIDVSATGDYAYLILRLL